MERLRTSTPTNMILRSIERKTPMIFNDAIVNIIELRHYVKKDEYDVKVKRQIRLSNEKTIQMLPESIYEEGKQ